MLFFHHVNQSCNTHFFFIYAFFSFKVSSSLILPPYDCSFFLASFFHHASFSFLFRYLTTYIISFILFIPFMYSSIRLPYLSLFPSHLQDDVYRDSFHHTKINFPSGYTFIHHSTIPFLLDHCNSGPFLNMTHILSRSLSQYVKGKTPCINQAHSRNKLKIRMLTRGVSLTNFPILRK